MTLSRYLKIYPWQNRPGHYLLYSTLRGSLVVVPGTTLDAARQGTLAGPEADTLSRLGMLVPDAAAELEQMRGVIERANGRSRTYRPTIVLNLDCNLDCCYCYEAGFRGGRFMSEETARLVVETLVREQISHGRDVSLQFYGGEPLLSLDLIRSISLPLLAAAERHGVRYSFGLVTNGTLLDRATALELVPLGLKTARITLDGPPEIHNQQRPFASGAGSFDSIVSNILAVCDLVQIQLGGNFLQENYREFPRVLDILISRGVTPEKLTQVQFTPITPQAGCSEYVSGCASSDEPWLMEALVYLRGEILSRGFATPKPSVSACVVELENSVVVGLDGSLYKCPAFMGWPELSIGTLEKGTIDYADSHCLGNWRNEECLECAYLPLCFGGCRFLNLVQGKPLSGVDCRRACLDATLERFLLQTMAYPGQVPKTGASLPAASPKASPAAAPA